MPTITLLLDLDDTLLDTNADSFAPAYFSALTTALAELIQPEIMLPALIGGTKAMVQNLNPSLSLEDVFYNYFIPAVQKDRELLRDPIDRFYDGVFPSLSRVTRQRLDAIEFVNWAFDNDYRVGVATNPYFPLKAVQHRMRWAGLPPEAHPFCLISSYETFHFTKEVTAFFPEFMAQIGWPDGPVLMVGNDLEMDVQPAKKAGFPVWWLKSGFNDKYPDIPQGTFKDLRSWLQNVDPTTITPTFSSRDAVIGILRSTPAAIASLVREIPLERWKNKLNEDEWCLTEILCHLRDVEIDINMARFEKILKEENPFFPGVVSDEWVRERQYASQDGHEALHDFMAARTRTLNLLVEEGKDFSQNARHAIFGPTNLLELASIAAGHDRAHVQQIWKTIRA